MVLPTTGPLSFTAIVGEFGGVVPHSLSEYYNKATGIPVSGTISFSDFRGKSNNPLSPTWTTGTTLASQPINQSFSRNLLATSDSPIISYAITSSPGFGTLSGLLTDKSVNLTGIRSTIGTVSWTITATDTENQSTPRTFSMTFTSTAPTWNTGTNLGTYNTGSYYTFGLSASSDSSVYYTMVSTGTGYGYISGGTNLTTYGVGAGTYYETVRATDQENQSTDRSFSITFNAPLSAPYFSQGSSTNIGYYTGGNFVSVYVQASGNPAPTHNGRDLTWLTVGANGYVYGTVPYGTGPGLYWFYIDANNSQGYASIQVYLNIY